MNSDLTSNLLLFYFAPSNKNKQEFYEYTTKTSYNNSIKVLSNEIGFDICGNGLYFDYSSRLCKGKLKLNQDVIRTAIHVLILILVLHVQVILPRNFT